MLILNFKRLFQIIKNFIQFINLNIVFIQVFKLLNINVLLKYRYKKTILTFIYCLFILYSNS